eukprot:2481900-Amphidinium_carterae.2
MIPQNELNSFQMGTTCKVPSTLELLPVPGRDLRGSSGPSCPSASENRNSSRSCALEKTGIAASGHTKSPHKRPRGNRAGTRKRGDRNTTHCLLHCVNQKARRRKHRQTKRDLAQTFR